MGEEKEKCLPALVADYGFSMDNNWEIMHGEICDKMLDKRETQHNKVKLARESLPEENFKDVSSRRKLPSVSGDNKVRFRH
jgi:hypothetical protein